MPTKTLLENHRVSLHVITAKDAPLTKESITAALAPHLHHERVDVQTSGELSQEEKAQRILEKLVGTGQTRIGAAPTQEAQEYMRQQILRSVQRGIPIEGMTNWGPLKFSRKQNESHADLADFFALESLIRLNNEIKAYHAPGMRFTIFLEDATADWLEKADSRLQSMKRAYTTSLRKLGSILSPRAIRFVRETQRLNRQGIGKKEYFHRARKNLERFKEYWAESEPLIRQFIEENPVFTETQWEQFCQRQLEPIDSYQKLREIGWKGFIHPDMRAYYRSKHSDSPGIDPDHEVCKYFSSTLLKHQLGLLNGDADSTPLKVSFVAVPPGTPQTMRRSPRIDLRILPKSYASTHMPSWTCKGVFIPRGDRARPCLRNWREVRENSDKLHQTSLVISRGKRKIRIRADILDLPK